MNNWAKQLKGVRIPSYDPRMGVWFDVAPLPEARLLWLNVRWFASEGIDLGEPEIAGEVEKWLLDRFGVVADNRADGDRTLFADRYGETGGAIHGGSGRAGSREGFYAKGIGRTPLVSSISNFHHSHGGLWLYEAVREIIASEVANAELPSGAVPTIALIDTGQDIHVPGTDELARRAISVRPDFVRPAIFERTILFGTSGTADSDQVVDAERVETAVIAAARGEQPFSPGFSLDRMFEQIATQVGAGRAVGLWQGQFTSSNVTVDGQWADLGAFCAMSDWRRAERALGPRFGTEDELIGNTIRSIFFSFAKYGGLLNPLEQTHRLTSLVPVWISRSFTATISRELRLGRLFSDSQAARILSYLSDFYKRQQRQNVRYEGSEPCPWLVEAVSRDGLLSSDVREFRDLLELDRENSFKAPQVRRIFEPRCLLFPDAADRAFKTRFNPTKYRFIHTAAGIQSYIDQRIGASRRAWPELDERYLVLSQSFKGAGSALLVADLDRGGELRWIISGILRKDVLCLGEREIPAEEILSCRIDGDQGLIARFNLPVDWLGLSDRFGRHRKGVTFFAGATCDWRQD